MMCEVCKRFMKYGETPRPQECVPELEIRLAPTVIVVHTENNKQKEEK